MLKKFKNNFGMASFLEVIISGMIFTIAAAGVMTTLSMLKPATLESNKRIEAAYIAKSKLEKMRSEYKSDPNAANAGVYATGSHGEENICETGDDHCYREDTYGNQNGGRSSLPIAKGMTEYEVVEVGGHKSYSIKSGVVWSVLIMNKLRCIKGLSLVELIMSSIMVGIVMLGIVGFSFTIKRIQDSTSKLSILSIRTSALLAQISRDIKLATGTEILNGILPYVDGDNRTICFRMDANADGEIDDNDEWICYYHNSDYEIFRCMGLTEDDRINNLSGSQFYDSGLHEWTFFQPNAANLDIGTCKRTGIELEKVVPDFLG